MFLSGQELVAGPQAEPVTLEQVKRHLYVEHHDDDTLLDELIARARAHVELSLGRALLEQTWEASFDAWSKDLALPRPPVRSVEWVKYLDVDGNEQTLDPSVYRFEKIRSRVNLKPGQVWPGLYAEPSAITVRFVAGYDPDKVPLTVVQAILLTVGHWYNNRENASLVTLQEIPLGVTALLSRLKVYGF